MDLLQYISDEMSGTFGFYQYIGKEESVNLGQRLNSIMILCIVAFQDGLMIKTKTCKEAGLTVSQFSDPFYFNCYKLDLAYFICTKHLEYC